MKILPLWGEKWEINGNPDDSLNAASAGWSYSAEAFAKGGDSDEQMEVSSIPVSIVNNNRLVRCQTGWKVIQNS